jgi:hypothetical protein
VLCRDFFRMAGDVARKRNDPILHDDSNCRRIYARFAAKFLFDVLAHPRANFISFELITLLALAANPSLCSRQEQYAWLESHGRHTAEIHWLG